MSSGIPRTTISRNELYKELREICSLNEWWGKKRSGETVIEYSKRKEPRCFNGQEISINEPGYEKRVKIELDKTPGKFKLHLESFILRQDSQDGPILRSEKPKVIDMVGDFFDVLSTANYNPLNSLLTLAYSSWDWKSVSLGLLSDRLQPEAEEKLNNLLSAESKAMLIYELYGRISNSFKKGKLSDGQQELLKRRLKPDPEVKSALEAYIKSSTLRRICYTFYKKRKLPLVLQFLET